MNNDLLQLLKKAVSGEEAASQALLTQFHEQAILSSEQEEIHLYLKQTSRDTSEAIYIRGLLYEHGYGVKQDVDMSFLLMREAAAKGNAKATYAVARYYLHGLGVDQNYENALQWLTIAAGSPNYIPDAMYELGKMYEEGLGVAIDEYQAKTWYEKAAKKGHSKAQSALTKR